MKQTIENVDDHMGNENKLMTILHVSNQWH